jgi:RNA recognition motif-containing protein
VEFVVPEDATLAQKEMDGKEMMGRVIKVDFARENPDRLQQDHQEESQED